jgi:hypothetical protein
MKISSWNAQQAEASISLLLGRIVAHNRIPMPPHQFWQSTWTKKFHDAYNILLCETYADVHGTFNTNYDVWAPVVDAGSLYCVHLSAQTRGDTFAPYIAISPPELSNICVPAVHERMSEWIRRCVDLQVEIENAVKQTTTVLTMANTAGQLKRMVPDLLRYLPREYTESAAKQERRSALPYAWASTPREPIYAALNTLAKAALLEAPKPGTGPNNDNWVASSLHKTHWAFKPGENEDDLAIVRERGWACT